MTVARGSVLASQELFTRNVCTRLVSIHNIVKGSNSYKYSSKYVALRTCPEGAMFTAVFIQHRGCIQSTTTVVSSLRKTTPTGVNGMCIRCPIACKKVWQWRSLCDAIFW